MEDVVFEEPFQETELPDIIIPEPFQPSSCPSLDCPLPTKRRKRCVPPPIEITKASCSIVVTMVHTQ